MWLLFSPSTICCSCSRVSFPILVKGLMVVSAPTLFDKPNVWWYAFRRYHIQFALWIPLLRLIVPYYSDDFHAGCPRLCYLFATLNSGHRIVDNGHRHFKPLSPSWWTTMNTIASEHISARSREEDGNGACYWAEQPVVSIMPSLTPISN